MSSRYILVASLFFICVISSAPFFVYADWDHEPYGPGETLNPECAPTDDNCTVDATLSAWGSDGTNVFRLTGGVMIGTSTPYFGVNFPLYVSTDNAPEGLGFVLGSPTVSSVGQVFFTNNNAYELGIDSAGKFHIAETGDDPGITMSSVGIGIGTTTPGSLFSIADTANFTAATTTFSSSGGINLTQGCFAVNGTCVGGALSQWTGDTSSISYNGNVGIGTGLPDARLSIENDESGITPTTGFSLVLNNNLGTHEGAASATVLGRTLSIAPIGSFGSDWSGSGSTANITGTDDSIDLSGLTLGAITGGEHPPSNSMSATGYQVDVSGTPTYNDTIDGGGSNTLYASGVAGSVDLNPTVAAGSHNYLSASGGAFSAAVTASGLNSLTYGVQVNNDSNLDAAGSAAYAGYFGNYAIAPQTYGAYIHSINGATGNTAYDLYLDGPDGSNANDYSLYSAGNAKSYFAGNVGIGTTSPGYKLDVNGDIDLTGDIYQNGVLFSGSDPIWNLDGDNTFFNGRNVGIGTSTPDAALSVIGDIHITHEGDNYFNFGGVAGEDGFGIRLHDGAMQFRSFEGDWTDLGAGGDSSWTSTDGGINSGEGVKIGIDTPSLANANLTIHQEAGIDASEQIDNGTFGDDGASWNVGDGWSTDDGATFTPLTTGTIATLSVGLAGSGYHIGDRVLLNGDDNGNVVVTNLQDASIAGVSGSGGFGYQIGDILTLNGGNNDAQVEVESVGDDGNITSLSLLSGGTGYTIPDSLTAMGEDGGGASFFLINGTGGIAQLNVIDGGAGFAVDGGYALLGAGDGNGIATVTSLDMSSSYLSQNGTLDAGDTYDVSLNVGGDAGSVDVCLDAGDCQTYEHGAGDVSFSGVWQHGAGVILYILPSYDFDGTVNDVSVQSRASQEQGLTFVESNGRTNLSIGLDESEGDSSEGQHGLLIQTTDSDGNKHTASIYASDDNNTRYEYHLPSLAALAEGDEDGSGTVCILELHNCDSGGFNTFLSTTGSTYSLDTSSWTTAEESLPAAFGYSQTAIIGNYIYLFGGYGDDDAQDTIYRALTSDPTHWSDTGETLPGPLSNSQVAVIGEYVYLFGGYNGSNTGVIYRAPVADPTDWSDTESTLPAGLADSQVAVIGQYVYLFGGRGSDGTVDTIYKAPVSNPTDWTDTGATLPDPLSDSQLVTVGDRIYLLGGGTIDAITSDLYWAPISDPTDWTTIPDALPSALINAQAAVIGDSVYLFGGEYEDTTNTIYKASISDLSSWEDTGDTLPGDLEGSQVAVIGNGIYLFGGYDGNDYTGAIYQATINSTMNPGKSWTSQLNYTPLTTLSSTTVSVPDSLSVNNYFNFGNTDGGDGFGIRNEGGTLQFKNESGGWTDLGAGALEQSSSTPSLSESTRVASRDFSDEDFSNTFAVMFGESGNKMYVQNQSTYYQYTLFTPYDITTAESDEVSFEPNVGEGNTTWGIAFSGDGTKVYVTDDNAKVYEYPLDEAWNLASVGDESASLDVSDQIDTSGGTDLTFNEDGTELFDADYNTGTVYQYHLSEAWNLSSATYADVSLDVSADIPEGSNLEAIKFTDDGSRFYDGIYEDGSLVIHQYTLGTPYDITTATEDDQSYTVADNAEGYFTFGGDDTTFYATTRSEGPDSVNEYEFGGGGTSSLLHGSLQLSGSDNYLNFGTDISSSGYGIRDHNGTLQFKNEGGEWTDLGAGLNFGFNGSSYTGLSYLTGETATPSGIAFGDGDTKMYVTEGFENTDIFEYSLSSADDVSSASYNGKTLDVSDQMGQAVGVAISDDGTKLFVSDGNTTIYQYTLETPWDVSSATYDDVALDAGEDFDGESANVSFADGGTRLLLSDYANQSVHQYTLDTPWDLSTATPSMASIDLSGLGEAYDSDAHFNTDGTKVYVETVIGEGSPVVFHEFSLDTPWDLSTAADDGQTYEPSGEVLTTPSSGLFALSSDGAKFYVPAFNMGPGFLYEFSFGTTSGGGGSGDVGTGTAGAVAFYAADGTTLTATSTLFIDPDTGNIGIGTSDPSAALDVEGAFSVDGGSIYHDPTTGITSIDNLSIGALSFPANAGVVSLIDLPVTSDAAASTTESYSASIGGTNVLTIFGQSDGAGGVANLSVGIGTTTPWRTLSVVGSVALPALTTETGISGSALCLSASGEVVVNSGVANCTLSSLRYKHSVEPLAISGTSTLMQLVPSSFIYNADASSTLQWGFIAEDLASTSPTLAAYGPDGRPQSINEVGILAVVVKALQELEQEVTSFADKFTTQEIDTQKLCVGDTCVTQAEFLQLLQSANVNSASDSTSSPDTDSTPPDVVVPPDDSDASSTPPDTDASSTPPDDSSDASTTPPDDSSGTSTPAGN